MKKVLILVISVILIIGCSHPNNELVKTSIINLIATPEKYHNKDVQVIGVVNLEFESNELCLSKSDLEYHINNNCLWIELGSEISYEEAQNLNGKYAIIEGTFDMNNKGHLGMYAGSITDITRYELWEDKENNNLKENQAIEILAKKLNDNRLKYIVSGTDIIEDQLAYEIRAYYDDGDHITTKGYYLVVIENNKIYQRNMIDTGYVEVK